MKIQYLQWMLNTYYCVQDEKYSWKHVYIVYCFVYVSFGEDKKRWKYSRFKRCMCALGGEVVVTRPVREYFARIVSRRHCRIWASLFRPKLGIYRLWAGRALYYSTPSMTSFCGFIRKTTQCCGLLCQARDTENVLTLIAVARSDSAFAWHAEGWVSESQRRLTYVAKTGSYSSTAKRLATGVSVTGPPRCPVS